MALWQLLFPGHCRIKVVQAVLPLSRIKDNAKQIVASEVNQVSHSLRYFRDRFSFSLWF